MDAHSDLVDLSDIGDINDLSHPVCEVKVVISHKV